MKILVTGANGYLGQGIVTALLNTGHIVVATDFDIEQIDSRAERIPCNIFEIEQPYYFFGKPDVLLHLAWENGFVHYSDSHIEGLPKHYHFIVSMAQAGIAKIAVMGSMHEVGFFEGSINEDTPCRPVTPYGISKNALRSLAELVCRQNDIIFQWFRGYYIVGNSPRGCSIFSKISDFAIKGEKNFPFTQGLNQFDFIEYEDFCHQVVAAVSQSQINGIINICTGRPEKLSVVVENFIKKNGYDIKLQYGAFPDRPYDSKAVWGDDRKIKAILKKI